LLGRFQLQRAVFVRSEIAVVMQHSFKQFVAVQRRALYYTLYRNAFAVYDAMAFFTI
jgi:hypothetical protein